jgi:signal peptidase I
LVIRRYFPIQLAAENNNWNSGHFALKSAPEANPGIGLPLEKILKATKETIKKNYPTAEQLSAELNRVKYRNKYRSTMRSTVYTLITVAAVSVLVAVLLLPVLQIYGTSMTPTLSDGNIVLSLKGSDFKSGDVIAFYYNNKILVKRVIATAGEWVDITEDGTVYVNNIAIEEPYISEKSLGECDLEFPYQVPESRLFVLGDHRNVSIDSRSTVVGCVAEEQIVGKIILKLWPLSEIGKIR